MKTTLLLLVCSNAFFGMVIGDAKNRHRDTSSLEGRSKGNQGKAHAQETDSGEPLFLTPLIKSCDFDKALEKSRVGSIGNVPDVTSYSGFITVNEKFGSNLFFWFVPAMENTKCAPVILWLQGGPGTSSLLGFFAEHGPYFVDKDHKPQLRDITWTRRFSVLYVDNPVGTGFSFTQSDEGKARNMSDVSRDMVEFLQQFFTLFHDYSTNDFYLAGESFAGKYISAIGTALHESRGQLRVNINLRGISLGNALFDAVSTLRYGEYLFNLGLLDRRQATAMQEGCDTAANMIRSGNTTEASMFLDSLIYGTTSYFANATGYSFLYNYLYTEEPASISRYETFVQFTAVRRALHVGQVKYKKDKDAISADLGKDIFTSATEQLSLLLDNYKVMHYSGQLDIAVAYPFTEALMRSLQWSGAQEFANATQKIWRSPDGKHVRGYATRSGNFTMLLVRNAGHMAPHDQPEAAYDAITRFINDIQFVG